MDHHCRILYCEVFVINIIIISCVSYKEYVASKSIDTFSQDKSSTKNYHYLTL